MANISVERRRVLAAVGLVGILSAGVVARVHQLETAADHAEMRADPNRWACMFVVRGYAFADQPGEFEAVAETAASFATEPKVKRGVRAYPDAAGRTGDVDPKALRAFEDGCGEYLPFDT